MKTLALAAAGLFLAALAAPAPASAQVRPDPGVTQSSAEAVWHRPGHRPPGWERRNRHYGPGRSMRTRVLPNGCTIRTVRTVRPNGQVVVRRIRSC